MSPSRFRSRSRSPRPPSKSSRSSGFRWKEKPRREDDAEASGNSSSHKRPERDFRDRRYDDSRRSGRDYERGYDDSRGERCTDEREKHRGEGGRRRDEGEHSRDDGDRRDANRPKPTPASTSISTVDDDIAAKFGAGAAAPKPASIPSTSASKPSAAPIKPPPSSKPRAKAQAMGPMIVVKINDRLGTTTKVPCLPSDSIGDLKKLVAMRIGRKPHEIMLKRQSERPFKDFLTLEDYGVGDGVQLDLELDTGD